MTTNTLRGGIEKVKDCGIYLSKLSTEIGKNKSYLSGLLSEDFTPSDEVVDSLRKSLKKRGVFLSNFNPDKHDPTELFTKASVNLNTLAEKIGVSRQALHKRHLSEEKLKHLTQEVRTIGNTLLKISS